MKFLRSRFGLDALLLVVLISVLSFVPRRPHSQSFQSAESVLLADLRSVPLHENMQRFPMDDLFHYKRSKDLQYLQTKSFVVQDSVVGPIARPNFRRRHIARNGDRVLFDVISETDRFSRRRGLTSDGLDLLVAPSARKARKHLLLFGCSFVFGEGLAQDETFPAHVVRASAVWNAYNYGFGGWGPANALARMQLPFESVEVPERFGAAVYVYLDFHLRRAVPSLSTARFTHQFPSFRQGENRTVVRAGFNDTEWPLLFRAFEWLGNSWLVARTNMDWPLVLDSSHYRYTAELLKELQREYLTKFPDQKFYVLFYPGSKTASRMRDHLNAAGVASIDLSGLDLKAEAGGAADLIPGDGHPTSQANIILARHLLSELASK